MNTTIKKTFDPEFDAMMRAELRAELEAFEKENPPFQKSIIRTGETEYKWKNHKHPENPNFMQWVHWRAYAKPDGRFSILFFLDPSTPQSHFVEYGTGDVETAIQKYL